MIRINGEDKNGYDDVSVEEMVKRENFSKDRIAVEVNGDIVSKSVYHETILHSGDIVEVVSFVGGG
ncbi:MAG: sulfur carrier protein ThiS [Eubacterium sp.]|nr:sulfur carrier protein ThiS [Eubacterium sp.]